MLAVGVMVQFREHVRVQFREHVILYIMLNVIVYNVTGRQFVMLYIHTF